MEIYSDKFGNTNCHNGHVLRLICIIGTISP